MEPGTPVRGAALGRDGFRVTRFQYYWRLERRLARSPGPGPLLPFLRPNPLPSLTSRRPAPLLSTPGVAGAGSGPPYSPEDPVVHTTTQTIGRHPCPALSPAAPRDHHAPPHRRRKSRDLPRPGQRGCCPSCSALHILLRALQATLKEACPTAPATSSMGTVSFLHRFGSSLSPHFHYHVCVVDGSFTPGPERLQI